MNNKNNRQFSESKEPTRTHSWKWNPGYDKMISDLSVSSLRFLQSFYKKERRAFTKQFDIFNSVYEIEYKRILRIEGMINEEIGNRTMNDMATHSNGSYDSDKGIYYNEDGKGLYSIAFNEDEDEFVYIGIDTKANSESTFNSGASKDDETDYELYEPTDRNASYELWNYTSLIDEDD
jgi:hypothetical protein